MAGLLDNVDQRTQLAGQNRLELLLFYLNDNQRFGINVFKVQEVMNCPQLTQIPGADPVIRGLATVRGHTVSVIDLNKAVGGDPLDTSESFVIVTEYNRTIQGFLVNGVDRIVNLNWKDVLPPPDGTAKQSYLTAVTHVDEQIVGIIDVEKILAEVIDVNTDVSDRLSEEGKKSEKRSVLVVDDSSVARNQVKRTFEQMTVECHMATNGQEALDILRDWAENDRQKLQDLSMVISDIEMPVMDGYTLTTEIRQDPALKHLYVMLHSSLSGVFNHAMVKKVGADYFVAKFDSNELAETFLKQVGGPIHQEAVPA